MTNPMTDLTGKKDAGGVEPEDEANMGQELAEAGAESPEPPQNIPDLGNPELSAPPDGMSDPVEAAETER